MRIGPVIIVMLEHQVCETSTVSKSYVLKFTAHHRVVVGEIQRDIHIDALRFRLNEEKILRPSRSMWKVKGHGMISETNAAISSIHNQTLDGLNSVAEKKAFKLTESPNKVSGPVVGEEVLFDAVLSPLNVPNVGHSIILCPSATAE